jgi:hypothetical protein
LTYFCLFNNHWKSISLHTFYQTKKYISNFAFVSFNSSLINSNVDVGSFDEFGRRYVYYQTPTPIRNLNCLAWAVMHTKLQYLGLYERVCDDFTNFSFNSFRLRILHSNAIYSFRNMLRTERQTQLTTYLPFADPSLFRLGNSIWWHYGKIIILSNRERKDIQSHLACIQTNSKTHFLTNTNDCLKSMFDRLSFFRYINVCILSDSSNYRSSFSIGLNKSYLYLYHIHTTIKDTL